MLTHIDWAEKAGSFVCEDIIPVVEAGLAVLGPLFLGPDAEVSSAIEAVRQIAGWK